MSSQFDQTKSKARHTKSKALALEKINVGITLYHADAVKLQNGNFYIAGLQLLNSKAIRIILGSTGFDLTIISSQRTLYGLREGTALHIGCSTRNIAHVRKNAVL